MNRQQIGGRRYVTRLKPRTGWPELTALIDILFLVMMFFFLSTSSVRVTGIPVNPPRVPTAGFADLERYVVTLARSTAAGESIIYFNDRPMTREELKQQFNIVHGRNRNAVIMILADRQVSVEHTVEIMALAEAARLSCFLVTAAPELRNEPVFQP